MLPSRVIDVGSPQGTEEPYLHISKEEVGEWVTLSYCWGQKTPLQTTQETLRAHQMGMSMNFLPPLFRDAVTITRELGHRYLWIDSLCIIQDDEEDRAREIAVMGTIYKKSVLTISADNCLDCNDMILGPPSPTRDITYTEQGCFSSKSIFTSKMYAFPRHPGGRRVVNEREAEAANAQGVLRTRAWTLQEHVLSPRTVRWLPLQIEWNCRRTTLSEQFPNEANNATGELIFGITSSRHNSPKLLCLSKEQLYKSTPQPSFMPPGCVNNRNSPLQIWYFLVQEFLSRNIRYETDSLPAIAGLAREVNRHTGHDYVAGLWAQDIHNALLWTIEHELKPAATKTDVYVGPSWSWISITKGPSNNLCSAALGPERSSYIYDAVELHLLPVAGVFTPQIEYTTEDHYGPIRSATLRLSAPRRALETFAENEIALPSLSDYQNQAVELDPSSHHVLHRTIKCWLDGRNGGEKDLEDVRRAVESLKEKGVVVVRIASLDRTRNLDFDSSGDGFGVKARRILDNQNWCLLLEPHESGGIVQEGNETERSWKRIGVARAADDLLGSGWETQEITIF